MTNNIWLSQTNDQKIEKYILHDMKIKIYVYTMQDLSIYMDNSNE